MKADGLFRKETAHFILQERMIIMAISTYRVFLMKKKEVGTDYEKLIDIKEFPDLEIGRAHV